MPLPGYDAWKTTPPDEPLTCGSCGAPATEGDYALGEGGTVLHLDCVEADDEQDARQSVSPETQDELARYYMARAEVAKADAATLRERARTECPSCHGKRKVKVVEGIDGPYEVFAACGTCIPKFISMPAGGGR